MQIDIWSDIACPWCFVGKKRFEAALENFEHREQVSVKFHSFQLNPNAPGRYEGSYEDYLMEAENISREQAQTNIREIVQAGAEAGVSFDFENQVLNNTTMSHQVLHMAQERGNGAPMKEALMRAYFVEGKDLSDVVTLVELGIAHGGLEQRETVQDLVQGTFSGQLRQDALEAAELGISSVPFFVFNGDFGVPGAQPIETFADALEQAWAEQQDS